MLINRLSLLLVLATTAASAPDTGPSMVEIHLPGRPNVTYAYAIADAKAFDVSVRAFDRPTQTDQVGDQNECNGLAVTGGFSSKRGNTVAPEGLIRTRTGQISDIAPWRDGGVISIQHGRPQIMRIADWRVSPVAGGMTVQAHPLLVFDGHVDFDLRRPERSNRIAVGRLKNGDIVFVGAFTTINDAVTLKQFAEDATRIFGGNLEALLNMDGGPSAFMVSKNVGLRPALGLVTTFFCAEHR